MIKRIPGYSYKNVQRILKEPSLSHNQLIILRDIKRMIECEGLGDQYSTEFLQLHGFYKGVCDPSASGMCLTDIWILNNITFRIDNPRIQPPSKSK